MIAESPQTMHITSSCLARQTIGIAGLIRVRTAGYSSEIVGPITGKTKPRVEHRSATSNTEEQRVFLIAV